MNIFKKYDSPDHSEKKCLCESKNHLCIDRHQTSRIVALLLIIACFIFVAGYFWGQRTAIDQLLNTVERDSFADQIHYSMCSIYDQKDEENGDQEPTNNEDDSEQSENEGNEPEVTIEVVADAKKTEKTEIKQINESKKYVAQLAGFGSEKNAQQLVQRLHIKGITVSLKKRQSKTARGKVVPWYQVTTQEYADSNELDDVVKKIKRHEKLHDIKIVEC